MAVLYQLQSSCGVHAPRQYFQANLEVHLERKPEIRHLEDRLTTHEEPIRISVKDNENNVQDELTAIDDYFKPLPSVAAGEEGRW